MSPAAAFSLDLRAVLPLLLTAGAVGLVWRPHRGGALALWRGALLTISCGFLAPFLLQRV